MNNLRYLILMALVAALVLSVAIIAHGKRKYSLIPIGKFTITEHQALRGQTDDMPNVGAYGVVALDGIPLGHFFANNRMPNGTKIIIPNLTGKKVWVLKDRLNSRYSGDHIDLLVHKNARLHGPRRAEVFIVNEDN